MSSSPRQIEPGHAFGPRKTASAADELALLRWAATRGFDAPEIRTIALTERTLTRVTVSCAARGTPIIGCGRDVNMSSALSRAYGEVCERLAAQEVYDANVPLRGHVIRVSGESIEVSSTEEIELPPPGLRTSNGWAVHFDLATAVRGAVAEALERHILLYTFFARGWAGFTRARDSELLGKRTSHASSSVSCAGWRAGMALALLDQHPGFTAGFTSAPVSSVEDFWLRAALEAAEPAVALDRQTSASLDTLSRSEDPLVRTQAYYARNTFPADQFGHPDPLDLGPEIDLRLACFDLSQAWSLPFPFFAAFVTGEYLIPLLFKASVETCAQSREVVHRLLSHYGLELPDVHPII